MKPVMKPMKRVCVFCVLYATAAVDLPAQTFTKLFSFDDTNGANPVALVQAKDGLFYGATYNNGASGGGTIFKIAPGGALTTLYSFCAQNGCTGNGVSPEALVQGGNGDFYGTTTDGGANCAPYGCGTVFKMTPAGALTTLYSFCSQTNCTDGAFPYGGLIQAANGDFYGTTAGGGASACSADLPTRPYCGTIFKIAPSGALTTVYAFCAESRCRDGANPYAGLVQAPNGDFYGTTANGGANGLGGTVFRITPSGTLQTLYSFCAESGCPDGDGPNGLVQAAGEIYGTTAGGGANAGKCSDCGGTVFTIAPGGKLTTLYNFCSQDECADGATPNAGLVHGTDGNFYGTTGNGGANLVGGTVFRITAGGALTTLYSFCSEGAPIACIDGSGPDALIQAANGKFYGTTGAGGGSGLGTVFSLSVGLAPFAR